MSGPIVRTDNAFIEAYTTQVSPKVSSKIL